MLGGYSEKFHVCNGVRQGGMMSPKLFSVYVDDLSQMLANKNVGCYLNKVCMNHLFYADDAVLLAPTSEGLQRLTDVCQSYAVENDMMYHLKKVFMYCFYSKGPWGSTCA